MDELAVMMDFSCEVRVIFRGCFEDDFRTICQSMSRKVDLAEGAFSYDTPECIVSNMS